MIEIRTSDYSGLGNVVKIADEFGAAVGIGSEGCFHRLPGQSDIEKAMVCAAGVTLVTPLTPQRHFGKMMEYLRAAPADIDVVVNDAGVLYAMSRKGLASKFNTLVAGRGLVHTSEACPWVEHILRGEAAHVKDAYLQTNFNYSRTYSLMQGLGIREIETDLLPGTVKAARKLGCPIRAHADYALVAFARSCHTARFYKELPPTCRARCNQPVKLQLRDMFELSALGFSEPGDELKKVFPELTLLGSSVYMHRECGEQVDRTVLTSEMYPLDGLRERVMHLRDLQ